MRQPKRRFAMRQVDGSYSTSAPSSIGPSHITYDRNFPLHLRKPTAAAAAQHAIIGSVPDGLRGVHRISDRTPEITRLPPCRGHIRARSPL